MARKNSTVSPVIAFNAEAAHKLGVDIGNAALSANVQASNIWDTARTHYVIAQGDGKAGDWVAAFSKGINSVKGKKAPWARTYRSILTRAAKLSVIITDAMGARAAQKAVKDAQDAALGDDAKIANALKFVANFVQAAVSAGATQKDIIATVKDALAEA